MEEFERVYPANVLEGNELMSAEAIGYLKCIRTFYPNLEHECLLKITHITMKLLSNVLADLGLIKEVK